MSRAGWLSSERESSTRKASSREYSRDSAARFESTLYGVWVLVMLWVPLPLGSVDAWATSLMQVMAFGLLATWCLGCALGWVEAPVSVRAARWLLVLMACWLGYCALYVLPLPLGWIEWLSPQAAAMHRETLGLEGGARTLAIDTHAAQSNWLKSFSYVAAFALTLLLVNSRDRVRQFATLLVGFAFVVAIFGIMMHLLGARLSWFGSVVSHGDVARGPYFNRNHFAGYLEMMLALGVGLLLADTSDRKADGWRKVLKRFLEWIFSRKFRLRLMLCVLVIALVCTRSRMGNTAFFASLLVAGLIGLALSRHAPRGTLVLLTSLIAIDLFIVGSWFGVEKLAQRLEQTAVTRSVTAAPGAEESIEARLDASADTVPMIKDHLMFGVGPGGWQASFLNYRGPEPYEGIYEHAHNDYAEFLSEHGVIGFTLLGIMVLWSLGVALRAQAIRRDPLMRGISFASFMGVLAILVHSWVDFNLQIPANAMYFMVLLALGWISLNLDRRSAKRGGG